MTILYLIILALLVLFSWVGSAYGLMLPDGMLIPNLLGADSVRYFVRHSIEHIASAPLVEVILLLMMISAVGQCGLWRYLVEALRERTLPTLTRRQVYSLRVSVVIFVVCVLIITLGFVGPQGNLLSVTGRVAGGPFAAGWLPLTCVCVCVPCVCYGWLSGVWSTERDILTALTTAMSLEWIAFIETFPRPGIPKKLSSISEPVKRYGIARDTYVTIGISEFRSTCTNSTRDSGSPFILAVRT